MSNTFSASRFGKYFLYDMRRWAASYGPTLLLMSAAPVILYVLIGIYTLLFNMHWDTPGETVRIIVGCIVTYIMVLTYPSNVYGYVTEKRAGSMFIMIPASVFEKTLSMILNTVLIVPLAFAAIYLSLDAVVCLVDGTCGGTLFGCAAKGINALVTFAFTSDAPVHVSLFSMYLNAGISTLFFLLAALIFKKHKILYPLLIVIGLQMVFSMLLGIFFTSGLIDYDNMIEWFGRLAEHYVLDPDFMNWAIPVFNALSTIFNIAVFGAFCAAVFFRVKTIKH